jgi:hypothetical protein
MVSENMLGQNWWEKFLERAYQSGFVAGGKLTGTSPPQRTPVPTVYRELASREFAGIAGAVVQQVSRHVAIAAISKRRPLPIYQRMLPVLKQTGQARVKTAINTMTVQLHNAGRLAQFRTAGVKQVGIDAERLEPAKPSRFLKSFIKRDHAQHVHDISAANFLLALASNVLAAAEEAGGEKDYFEVMTAGDDLVCPVCEALATEGPYEMDLADALIPAHPNCRCTLVPAGAFTQEQRLGEE